MHWKHCRVPAAAMCSLVRRGWNPTNGTCIDMIKPRMYHVVYAGEKKNIIFYINLYKIYKAHLRVTVLPLEIIFQLKIALLYDICIYKTITPGLSGNIFLQELERVQAFAQIFRRTPFKNQYIFKDHVNFQFSRK